MMGQSDLTIWIEDFDGQTSIDSSDNFLWNWLTFYGHLKTASVKVIVFLFW